MGWNYSAWSCDILRLIEENGGEMSYASLIEKSPIGCKHDTARILVYMLKNRLVKGAMGAHCQISITPKGKRKLFAHRIEEWYWCIRVALQRIKYRR